MTARLRIIVAASACLLAVGSPALAQDAAQQAAPAQNAIVGPPQLSNFSLNGTVTRQAPAAPVRSQPARRIPAERQTSTTMAPPPSRAQRVRNDTAPPARTTTAARESAEIRPRPQPTVPAAGLDEPPASAPATDASATLPSAAANASSAVPSQSLPVLPWIVAALVAAVAAAWFFFFRKRSRESYAGVSSFDLQAPAPDLPGEPRAAPAPKPAQPKVIEPAPPAGIVSTRLRPWLEIEFRPDRAVVDDNRAAVAFEIFVSNSGNIPARDVLLEASLFNAGPMQDQQIQLFFDNPVAKGDRIPIIPPGQRINVNTAVFMAREQVQPIEIEGRPLFVPMIAFNALYRWGGSEGQTSASYLVGKETTSEKLAPFRLDLGPRIFRGLGAREHALRIRK